MIWTIGLSFRIEFLNSVKTGRGVFEQCASYLGETSSVIETIVPLRKEIVFCAAAPKN